MCGSFPKDPMCELCVSFRASESMWVIIHQRDGQRLNDGGGGGGGAYLVYLVPV